MQNESGNYAGRRTLITDSINRLIEYIEEHSDEEADPFLQIKQYKRVEQIGSGGFGCVFKYHNWGFILTMNLLKSILYL